MPPVLQPLEAATPAGTEQSAGEVRWTDGYHVARCRQTRRCSRPGQRHQSRVPAQTQTAATEKKKKTKADLDEESSSKKKKKKGLGKLNPF